MPEEAEETIPHVEAGEEAPKEEAEEVELKKTLTYPVILLITVNSILGTGIFFLPSVGARISGPASILAWLIMSFIAIYISMCFGELVSMFPKSGGVYEFCKQAYGRFWSFIVGWTTFLVGNITIAMLISGAIEYILPIEAPFIKIGLSIMFIIIFNYVAFVGMDVSAALLVGFSIVTLGTLLSVIIPNFLHLNFANISPFFVFPASSILVTVFVIAETFFGWESATFLAGETKDGAKVMPKALILGTVIICFISLIYVGSSFLASNWIEFSQTNTPLTFLGGLHFGDIGSTVMTFLVYLAIIGSVAAWIVSAPRLLMSMAKDKLFLSRFGNIDPKHRTPKNAIILQTILVCLFVVMGSGLYLTLLHLLLPLALTMYIFVILSVVILRYKKPELERPYRAPLGKIGPILTVLVLLFFIVMWTRSSENTINILKFGGSFILIGLPLYFLIELYYNPKMISKVTNLTAHFTLFTEKINIPSSVKTEVLQLMGDIKGKTILEYGCGVGTFTKTLAERVGPVGRVYSVDHSISNIRITKKRVEKMIWSTKEAIHGRVYVIHDDQQLYRLHPTIASADAIISFGMLSYIQDTKRVLKEMYDILPSGGQICFIEYSDYFKVIPNVEWLSHNDIIEKIFRQAGFSVRVIRKKGLFWNYIYVYGIKYEKDVAYI